MDELVLGLGPSFAAGFALQRLLEIADPVFAKLDANLKKLVLNLIAFLVGVALAWWGGLRVLEGLGADAEAWVDVLVTGLVVSGGTEGFNSIMKFLGYKKEEKKEQSKKASGKTEEPAAG
jgi:hypothetical protein